MQFKIKDGTKWKQFAKGILIEPDIALNGSASQIFAGLSQGKNQAEILAALKQQYSVEEEILEEDYRELTEALETYGVLERV